MEKEKKASKAVEETKAEDAIDYKTLYDSLAHGLIAMGKKVQTLEWVLERLKELEELRKENKNA